MFRDFGWMSRSSKVVTTAPELRRERYISVVLEAVRAALAVSFICFNVVLVMALS